MTASGPSPIRIGTLDTELARARSAAVAQSLTSRGAEVELVTIMSTGVAGLRDALGAGQCDVLVHSLADVPTAPAPGLVIGAVLKRADARDALVARDALTLDTLPVGALVGCGTARRAAQLRARRPDVVVVDLVGEGATALALVSSSEVDAVVLAAADLDQLGRGEEATQRIGLDGWPPSAGQGALALEVRAENLSLVAALDHRPTRTMVEAERAVLAILDLDEDAPIGARAFTDDGMLFLDARVYSPDGSRMVTSSHALYLDDTTTPAADVAGRVAAELIALGAFSLGQTLPE